MKKNNQTRYLSAASIMQRLPFYRQMTASQAQLIKCLPIWNKWATHNLINETAKAVQLSHYQDGELTLHCENAISATQIKQQQQTLLLFFQGEGITELKQISVRISNNFSSSPTASDEDKKQTKSNSDHLIRSAITPDDNSLNSLKTVQKSTKNSALSDSLTKLIRTIEQNNKNN